ncbi:MAG TPA: hypothetical protein PLJ60_03320 [Chryseolinea sp.]|nr:hypothetical protein [Chryseolinea sp.]HPH45384.1 hypothetical protein [Chryseolinea sp.]HPM29344.1 hypothetical protein [Chryseolinea sp.]
MNLIEEIKKDPNRLFVTFVVLVIGAILTRSVPILSFIALAPLFAMTDQPDSFRSSYRVILVAFVAVLILYFFLQEKSILNIAIYLALSIALFWTFTEVHHIRQNVVNMFMLVILHLGIEYLILKFTVTPQSFFLADLIEHQPTWTRWNIHTGYLGSSLWILSTNLIFYLAIFNSGKIRKWPFVIAILLVVLPIMYSLYLSNPAVNKTEMVMLYTNEGFENIYSRNGELISRTGAWVSVLIIIFTIVKSKTKRNQK